MMLWLVEKIDGLTDGLISALKRGGYKSFIIDDLSSEDDLSKFESLQSPIIYYGSLNLAMKLKERFPSWYPGIYGDGKWYKCTNYYPLFGENHINHDYTYMTFGDFNKELVKDKPLFVRPDSILKEFTGTVVSFDDFDEKYKLMSFYDDVVTPELPIIVSSVKNILGEWRFIVIDNEIISGEKCNDEVLKFATEMAKTNIPDRVWVLDICLTDSGYKVLEIGCFSFAEIYSRDYENIIKKVELCQTK